MRSFTLIRLNAEDFARLVQSAQRDQDPALDTLLAAARPSLLHYFRRRLPADDAEDLTQLALLRITRALPRIEPERASAFIGTIAHNLLRTTQRRIARDAKRFASNAVLDTIATTSSDEESEQLEFIAALRQVSITMLPRELGDIILALLNGQSHAEIAALQGVRPVTVRTRLVRAREILRRELRQFGMATDLRRVVVLGSPRNATAHTPQNDGGNAEVWWMTRTRQRDHSEEE